MTKKKRRSTRKSDHRSEEKAKTKAKEEKEKENEATSGERSADEELYTRNVLIRGEAARPDEEGELPPEATHEIVEGADEEGEGELPEIRRRRFSAY